MSSAASAIASLPRSLAARVGPALALSPRMRTRLMAVAILAAVLALAYFGWFRNSSFVAVERVTVTGLTAENAPQIRAAITDAARGMTTLNVERDDLDQAVGEFAVVHELRVSPDFPHDLRVEVIERRPVAVLVAADGDKVPVAGDGTVLRGVEAAGTLPPIELGSGIPRHRVGDPEAMRSVRVIAAAPDALAARIDTVSEEGAKGIVAQLGDGGPEVILGDDAALEAKWAAAARILADPAAEAATYVDVRLPERPVAGGISVEAATAESGGASPPAPEAPSAAPAPAPPAASDPAAPVTPAPVAPAPTPPAESPAPTG